jgi:hypothetical protein
VIAGALETDSKRGHDLCGPFHQRQPSDPAVILVDRDTNGANGVISDFGLEVTAFLSRNGQTHMTDGEPGFIANILANSAYSPLAHN